jgi:hypothetical protein
MKDELLRLLSNKSTPTKFISPRYFTFPIPDEEK